MQADKNKMSNQGKNDYSTPLSGRIRTSFFHQSFTVIARASLIFTILLVILLSTSFWFKLNAIYLGVPAVIISLFLSHFLLKIIETKLVARLFAFVHKGQPIVVYQDWLQIEDFALVFGVYRLLWSAIDYVSLSHFGNLIFSSRALCGPELSVNKKDNNPATKVLKVPFSVIDLQTQKYFVDLLKEKCPQAKISSSLAAITDKPILKSTNYIHLFTMLVFLAILFDVGYSTFRYVELLKRYYLADQVALTGNISEGQSLYGNAEQLRIHTPFFSMVSGQLFSKGQSLAVVQEARSRTLWSLGEKDKALLAQQSAAKLMPKSFKVVLREARLCIELGKVEEAQDVITNLISKHKHALLPRLYLASSLWQNNKMDEARTCFKEYLSLLNEEYFSPPPVWPSSGEEVLHELFYRDDLNFLIPDKLSSPHK